jgi:hypothetical protein
VRSTHRQTTWLNTFYTKILSLVLWLNLGSSCPHWNLSPPVNCNASGMPLIPSRLTCYNHLALVFQEENNWFSFDTAAHIWNQS